MYWSFLLFVRIFAYGNHLQRMDWQMYVTSEQLVHVLGRKNARPTFSPGLPVLSLNALKT